MTHFLRIAPLNPLHLDHSLGRCFGEWIADRIANGEVYPARATAGPIKQGYSRERQGGGGKTAGGGWENLSRRPPMENSFRPPSPISLMKSLTNSQNFPQATPSKTVFGGSPKMAFKGPSSRGFASPPLFCLPLWLGPDILANLFARIDPRESKPFVLTNRGPIEDQTSKSLELDRRFHLSETS